MRRLKIPISLILLALIISVASAAITVAVYTNYILPEKEIYVQDENSEFNFTALGYKGIKLATTDEAGTADPSSADNPLNITSANPVYRPNGVTAGNYIFVFRFAEKGIDSIPNGTVYRIEVYADNSLVTTFYIGNPSEAAEPAAIEGADIYVDLGTNSTILDRIDVIATRL